MDKLNIHWVHQKEQFSEIMQQIALRFHQFGLPGVTHTDVVYEKMFDLLNRSAFLRFESDTFSTRARDLEDAPRLGEFDARVRDAKLLYQEACRRESDLLEDQADTVLRVAMAGWISNTKAWNASTESIWWQEDSKEVRVGLADIPLDLYLNVVKEHDVPSITVALRNYSPANRLLVTSGIEKLANQLLDEVGLLTVRQRQVIEIEIEESNRLED